MRTKLAWIAAGLLAIGALALWLIPFQHDLSHNYRAKDCGTPIARVLGEPIPFEEALNSLAEDYRSCKSAARPRVIIGAVMLLPAVAGTIMLLRGPAGQSAPMASHDSTG